MRLLLDRRRQRADDRGRKSQAAPRRRGGPRSLGLETGVIARARTMNTQVTLLGARRFMPLFATQTLGAFNDNLFKSAFVMLVTYGTAMRGGFEPGVLAACAGGALIAPYFLFSALAG